METRTTRHPQALSPGNSWLQLPVSQRHRHSPTPKAKAASAQHRRQGRDAPPPAAGASVPHSSPQAAQRLLGGPGQSLQAPHRARGHKASVVGAWPLTLCAIRTVGSSTVPASCFDSHTTWFLADKEKSHSLADPATACSGLQPGARLGAGDTVQVSL